MRGTGQAAIERRRFRRAATRLGKTLFCQLKCSVNLLLKGPDNFVSKLYPIAIRRIGPGWVQGQERLIATTPGPQAWPKRAATLRLYRYTATGALLDKDKTVRTQPDTSLTLKIPKDGLVIAEIVVE